MEQFLARETSREIYNKLCIFQVIHNTLGIEATGQQWTTTNTSIDKLKENSYKHLHSNHQYTLIGLKTIRFILQYIFYYDTEKEEVTQC